MSLRHVLYAVLTATPAITAVYGTRIVDAGELGATDGQSPVFPYLSMQWGNELPTASATGLNEEVELWSYDDPRDYTRTKVGLEAIKATLHKQGPWNQLVEGRRFWIGEARWLGTSRDLQDDALRASAKYATYRLVGNIQ